MTNEEMGSYLVAMYQQNPAEFDFQEDFRLSLKLLGLTQERAAQLLKLSRRTVVRYLEGVSAPTPRARATIFAALYNVSVSEQQEVTRKSTDGIGQAIVVDYMLRRPRIFQDDLNGSLALLGITYKEAAKRVGFSESTLRKWRRGELRHWRPAGFFADLYQLPEPQEIMVEFFDQQKQIQTDRVVHAISVEIIDLIRSGALQEVDIETAVPAHVRAAYLKALDNI